MKEPLRYKDLFEPYMERNFFERSEDAIVRVEHSALGRGSFEIFLEPGESFEVSGDDPTNTVIEVLE